MKIKSRLVLLIMLLSALMPWSHAMADMPVKIDGKVEAVDTSASPRTLVMKSAGPKGRELTVGCRLEDKTIIKAGNRDVKLNDLRMGDRVQLTYLRVEDGLICQKIEKK